MFDKILRKNRALPSLIFLLVLMAVFGIGTSHFISLSNFTNIGTAMVVIGLMALGATFVIAAGGIDLSSASIMALAGTSIALFAQSIDLPAPVWMLMAALIGAACGLANGLLVVFTRAPSFIITLGMLSIARAAAFILTQGLPVYGIADNLTRMGQGRFAGIPGSVWILLGGIVIAFILLWSTRFGAQILAIGDDQVAATAMGVPVDWQRIKLYSLAGAYSGLAGFVFVARTNMGDPAAGEGYQLIAITAIILGGTSLFGGRATILGTVIGTLCLGVLQNGLNLLTVSTYYQILFVGVVLVFAAWLSRLQREP